MVRVCRHEQALRRVILFRAKDVSYGGYGGPRHVDYGEKEEADHPVIPGMPAAAPPRKEPKKEKKDTKRKDTEYVSMSAFLQHSRHLYCTGLPFTAAHDSCTQLRLTQASCAGSELC